MATNTVKPTQSDNKMKKQNQSKTPFIQIASSATLTLMLVATSAQPAFAAQPASETQAIQQNCAMPAQSYGRMFANLPAANWSASDIDALSARIMAAQEDNPTPQNVRDAEESAEIDAGYTYVGQFIDHDLTLDDRPNDLTTPTPITALTNLRTPQLDLDSVYGKGPKSSPQLYEADGMHLKVGKVMTGSADAGAVDVPRDARGAALLGDPRNDENQIVSQMHTLFLRLHNKIVDDIKRQRPNLSNDQVLAQARQQVTWHYQWAVLTDFLPAMVGQRQVDDTVQRTQNGWRTNLRFYSACQQMPVEFSVAAYRFGHSMVRALYRINDNTERLPVFVSPHVDGKDLTGFGTAAPGSAIDWRFFFQLNQNRSIGEPQSAYKFDNSLTFSLSQLPLPATGTGPASLAKRNLLRSAQLGLPSGQSVARAMGVPVLRDDQILIGKATGDAADAVAITDISPAFANNAPLWTYILAEATAHAYPVADGKIQGAQHAPFRLGPVGGRIVAETFVGLMASDPNSILNHPEFRPVPQMAGRNGQFGFVELVRAATRPARRP
jgi:hypothetical protein